MNTQHRTHTYLKSEIRIETNILYKIKNLNFHQTPSPPHPFHTRTCLPHTTKGSPTKSRELTSTSSGTPSKWALYSGVRTRKRLVAAMSLPPLVRTPLEHQKELATMGTLRPKVYLSDPLKHPRLGSLIYSHQTPSAALPPRQHHHWQRWWLFRLSEGSAHG